MSQGVSAGSLLVGLQCPCEAVRFPRGGGDATRPTKSIKDLELTQERRGSGGRSLGDVSSKGSLSPKTK